MPEKRAEAVVIVTANYEADMHALVDAMMDAMCQALAPVLYGGDFDAACAAVDRKKVHEAVEERADRLRKDMERYTNADNNLLQRMRGELELQIEDVKGLIAAVAEQQARIPGELREALRGVSHDIAEEVRAVLLPVEVHRD